MYNYFRIKFVCVNRLRLLVSIGLRDMIMVAYLPICLTLLDMLKLDDAPRVSQENFIALRLCQNTIKLRCQKPLKIPNKTSTVTNLGTAFSANNVRQGKITYRSTKLKFLILSPLFSVCYRFCLHNSKVKPKYFDLPSFL